MVEDLGNIGKFVGAIGVVASLLYLPWKARRNPTIQLRSKHRLAPEEPHASVRSAAESAELASSPDVPSASACELAVAVES